MKDTVPERGTDRTLKAALGDVAPEVAFWRPSPERHNLAEVAFHHTFCARSVRGQLSGTTPEPFVLSGSLGRKFTQPWKRSRRSSQLLLRNLLRDARCPGFPKPSVSTSCSELPATRCTTPDKSNCSSGCTARKSKADKRPRVV